MPRWSIFKRARESGLYAVPRRLNHGQGLHSGCDGLHTLCGGQVLEGIERGFMYGVRSGIDHEHWHEWRCKLVHGVRGGQVLDSLRRGVVH